MTGGNNLYFVSVEIKRTQTYLFSVPKLKAMVGANVILGETLRGALKSQDCLAAKAVECGSCAQTASETDFKKMSNDPLTDEDKPWEDFNRGVISRDGGHFIAVFNELKKAENFCSEAAKLIANNLPGILFEIKYWVAGEENNKNDFAQTSEFGEAIPMLPQIEICQYSGLDRAGDIDYSKDEQDVDRYISANLRAKFDAADKVKDANAHDIASLINKYLKDGDSNKTQTPEDFSEMCGNDYMAVIHADGNDMGSRINGLADKNAEHLLKELEYAKFYYSMRQAARISLVKAIRTSFGDHKYKGYQPFRILMLGGDDLLFVCRAKYAFSFIIEYAKELQNHKLYGGKDKDGKVKEGKAMTIGAGIVIAKQSLPFYRLHETAEELAGSAKRLIRKKPDGDDNLTNCSVIDWIVSTDSYLGDIKEMRQGLIRKYRANGVNETLVLSQKPMPILGQDSLWSLEGLVNKANSLQNEDKAARNKLKLLTHELGSGRRYAELLFKELPKDTSDALEVDTVFAETGSANVYKTYLHDLIEVSEVQKLGGKKDEA